MTIATFGAGCFWGVEAAFRELKGVTDASVGYMGGHSKHPIYKEVCSGTTGHAEVCQVEFNEEVISYEELLDAFWKMHDPTQKNRQGPDVGSQYRSIIFYYTTEQKEVAEQSINEIEKKIGKKIATELISAKKFTFYKAEEYHQRYFEKNGGGACHI